jgi:putative intracellular protease/amidase
MTTTQPMTKPVLFVLTSHGSKGSTGEATGYYLGEVTHTLSELNKADLAVEFASIQGGEPPVDGLDLGDPINASFWNDATFRAQVANTKRLDEVDPSKYAAIFFAGGHGAMWDFPFDEAVRTVTRSVYEAGGVVGARERDPERRHAAGCWQEGRSVHRQRRARGHAGEGRSIPAGQRAR